MKKLLSIALTALAVLAFAISSPVLAADAGAGAGVFNANCAACHAGGNNVVQADKTLKADALSANGMDSADAIINQVTNGKGGMPAFGASLSSGDIENVAAYVLDQADKW
ncbi:c-type cytochrome [Acaryochloris sp. 'Moss Beach']|uniref:cytochrome c6 PetJ n=1 Tax=Acaryochloris TaxID=155977 RepID=UPI001BAF332E|nr:MULTISPECIES: c-type cytochrome [Acaryochloris]QUY43255.1 c-type cytochrome [Acaryochloris marina S15]UJB68096.1 c-type cytochrome [Acaryochloris sp. 'Moss Beach']